MPEPPATRILSYRASTPTAVRQTAFRWLRITGAISFCIGCMVAGLLLFFFLRDRHSGPIALGPWLANRWPYVILAVVSFATPCVYLPLATPILQANRLACYVAIYFTFILQLVLCLFTFMFVGGAIAPFFVRHAPWFYLYAIPAGLCLFSLTFVTDLCTLLQWIPRHPDAETSLDPFFPRPPTF